MTARGDAAREYRPHEVRLGIDLAKIDKGKPLPADFVPDCPGAHLRVVRKDFDDFVAGREQFRTERKDIPVDGYGYARVYCTQGVEQVIGTSSGQRLFYGLCRSCSRMEADNRLTLRDRAKAKGAG